MSLITNPIFVFLLTVSMIIAVVFILRYSRSVEETAVQLEQAGHEGKAAMLRAEARQMAWGTFFAILLLVLLVFAAFFAE